MPSMIRGLTPFALRSVFGGPSLAQLTYLLVPLLGQSNMTGSSSTLIYSYDSVNDPTDPRILQWTFDANGTGGKQLTAPTKYPAGLLNTVSPAIDPLNHPVDANSPSRCVGPGMPFARALLPSLLPHQRIVLVPLGVGGTGVVSDQWAPVEGSQATGELFRQARAQITACLNFYNGSQPGSAAVDTMIWCQMENDISKPQGNIDELWQADVASIFTQLRAIPGVQDSRILISPFRWANYGAVPVALRFLERCAQMSAELPKTIFVQGDSAYTMTTNEQIHFSFAAQRLIGAEIAARASEVSLLTSPAPTPSASLIGEVVKIDTTDRIPVYEVQYKPAGSGTWLGPIKASRLLKELDPLYVTIPGTGARDVRVSGVTPAGRSAFVTFSLADPGAGAAPPTPYFELDPENGTYDGSDNLTAITDSGSAAATWSIYSTPPKRVLVGGRAAWLMDNVARTTALSCPVPTPAGDYTALAVVSRDFFSTAAQTLFGITTTASIGVSIIVTASSIPDAARISIRHNNGTTYGMSIKMPFRTPGAHSIGARYTVSGGVLDLVINGAIVHTWTGVPNRSQASGTKALNNLADSRSDGFSGAAVSNYRVLNWRWYNSAMSQSQLARAVYTIRQNYGVDLVS